MTFGLLFCWLLVSAVKRGEVLEAKQRLDKAAPGIGSYSRELHGWVIDLDGERVLRNEFATRLDEALTFEAFDVSLATSAGFASFRSGTRNAALIPTMYRPDWRGQEFDK